MARQIAPTPHLIWAAGHFLTFFCGLRYLISAVTLRGGSSRWYTVAYLGALVSYGVVVYNRFGMPQVSKAWLQRAVMEENVQYLFLALYWWINKPIFLTLVPFVTFSMVHVLNFVSKVVIPYAFPSAAPAPSSSSGSGASSAASQTLPAKVARQMQLWIRNNYEHSMRLVSWSETLIFARLLLGAVLLRNSLLAPLIFAHFLRLRFYMSSFTRGSWQQVGAKLDALTAKPECPAGVRRAYLTLMDLVGRYASTVMSVPHGAGATGTGAGAGQASTAGGPAAAAAAASPKGTATGVDPTAAAGGAAGARR